MKTDLTITRTIKVNVGNFSNVETSVQVTKKDIEEDQVAEITLKVAKYLDGVTALELLKGLDEAITANTIGVDAYRDALKENVTEIKKTIIKNA